MAVFVPINPVLKADQVRHILRDCDARILVTSRQRIDSLSEHLHALPNLTHIVLIDADAGKSSINMPVFLKWSDVQGNAEPGIEPIGLEDDMTAIFYTSGSTGKPKGVVLSHRNVVTGALSVAAYLENRPDDRILSLLPLSFDAGFSQLTTAFSVGARVVLLDYLIPRDVVRVCERERSRASPAFHRYGCSWSINIGHQNPPDQSGILRIRVARCRARYVGQTARDVH